MDEAALIATLKADRRDSEVFALLFERYRLLALRVISHYHLQDFTVDDWLQEARLAMLNAVSRYRQDSGSQFQAYYLMVLKSHLRSLVRARLAQKRLADINPVLVADVHELLPRYHTGRDQEDDYILAIDLPILLAKLSAIEAQSFLGAMADDSVADSPRVRRARERTRMKLERYLREH